MIRFVSSAAFVARCHSLLSLLFIVFICGDALAGGGPRNVLVVQNNRSKTSMNIARYYADARGIPPENVCTISCLTNEIVDYTECEANIKSPIRAFLQNPLIKDHIDYIVLTKGIPLGVKYKDPATNDYFSSGPLALTSVLTCIDEPSINTLTINPYGPEIYPAIDEAFTHQKAYGGLHLYIVTRLDGYTEQDIYSMIDRSVAAERSGSFVIDRAVPVPNKTLNDRLKYAKSNLVAKGLPVIYDDTSMFLGGLSNVIGYFSWGSNDPCFNATAYRSNVFAPGSIADTYVSSSARTFNPTTGGQSLIVDLINQGACGVGGYVSEPYSQSIWPQVLFDRYTKGYNMAESFFAANPRLFWKHTIVGDPLMAPFATHPYVAIDSTDKSLTGWAIISATAIDPLGIARVDFYVDGVFKGSAFQPPYAISIDTTTYTVGAHNVEAIAVQGGPVASQASTQATVSIQNPISNLRTVSDAFPSADGQGVKATNKVVTAGTCQLGSNEFYIQDENGYSGIRVISDCPVDEGDLVTVIGDLETDSSERTINATSVTITERLLTRMSPIFMINRAVGGGAFSATTPGVTGGLGLRSLGLLVRTYGKVTYTGTADEDYFYIDDGSGLHDSTGNLGLRVVCRSIPKPPVNAHVSVTGISSCLIVGDTVIPVIKVRKPEDLNSLY